MLPAQERCKGIKKLIAQEQYFVIHAARQTGKTTLLLDLTENLNASGEYYTLYCSLESIQGIGDAERGIPAVVRNLIKEIEFNKALDKYPFAQEANFSDFNNVLVKSLYYFCKKLDKPLIILFDEADCLAGETLISFLRQLRDGYVNRNRIPFVHSVGLIGMRNIRDYKAKIREDQNTLGSASPFNIVRKILTLRNFTKEEIIYLYSQHTKQTGHVFSEQVIDNIWFHTWGQPWLVNAVAAEIIEEILESDISSVILPEHTEQAVRNIIFRRDTHIDSLLERLKEDRVRKVIEPLITGESTGYDLLDDDYQYAKDLGLIRERKSDKKLVPANPIYAEVIIRGLSFRSQSEMDHRDYPPGADTYLTDDNRLDMNRLLTDFQQFWREHSAIWIERYEYKEAAPHLILTAFFQRVINAGGRISREFASGRGRLDMCVHYKRHRYPVEIKLRYSIKTYEQGKKQLAEYMDTLGCNEGWLIVFDRRKSISWKKKLFWKTEKSGKRQIHVVGC
ncbi:AAA-like domain-containing protein [Desulfobacterales bacterium HSG17]|nr:AAA-like domain-containing protein [Desulfobacterales bacterium HSG17]